MEDSSVGLNGALHADALQANQQGSLTDEQRHNLDNYLRGRNRSALRWALIPLAIAAIILFVPGANPRPLLHYGVPLACIVIAAGIALWSLSGVDRLTHDVRAGRVESLEGAIGKVQASNSSNSPGNSFRYYLQVGDRRFKVSRQTYEAAPDAGYVRIYYLARSKHVVNLEQLHGRPDGRSISPQEALQNLTSAYSSHDRGRRNEASADIQSLNDQMKANVLQNAVAPSGAIARAHELSRELIGTWRNPMLTLTFHSNGTVEANFALGNSRTGHWSVDKDGRLRSDVRGQEGATDAWIEGDQLTIELDGTGLTLNRVAG